MSDTKIPDFKSMVEAWAWMRDEVDDPCVDNHRFVFLDAGPKELHEYDEAEGTGCCGSFDRIIKINGRLARIGCNYGH